MNLEAVIISILIQLYKLYILILHTYFIFLCFLGLNLFTDAEAYILHLIMQITRGNNFHLILI